MFLDERTLVIAAESKERELNLIRVLFQGDLVKYTVSMSGVGAKIMSGHTISTNTPKSDNV